MSNAVLEAMACGLPVLASDIPGNSDLVRHRENGLLFDVSGREALNEFLEEILGSPEKRGRFGSASRAAAVRSFSVEQVGARYLDLVGRLLDA